MRQIKFRGKRVDNGEWAYGTYHFSNDGKYHYILAREKFTLRPNEENAALPSVMALYKSDVSEVIPETVGQLSDIPDKNGSDVYKGDRLKMDIGEDDEVIFKNGCFWLRRRDIPLYMCENKFEVIGTIHEPNQPTTQL